MLPYKTTHKQISRKLRSNLTDSEKILWKRIRNKQILSMQFYRQKPIGAYIVDFYCPKANLNIEIDGSQHFQNQHLNKDQQRDEYSSRLGLTVLRFDNIQVLTQTLAVLEKIYAVIENNTQ